MSAQSKAQIRQVVKSKAGAEASRRSPLAGYAASHIQRYTVPGLGHVRLSILLESTTGAFCRSHGLAWPKSALGCWTSGLCREEKTIYLREL